MGSFEQMLQTFTAGGADRNWIVAQLAESDDARVIVLFLRTLSNLQEDDGVRIEILKHLVLRDDSPDVRQRFGDTILEIIKNDEDDLVRQHATTALRHYIDIDKVLTTLESLVQDRVEDIDVRHNALWAIEANRLLPACRDVLRRLVSVPELGRSAQRALDEL